jgi:hypothetical protein
MDPELKDLLVDKFTRDNFIKANQMVTDNIFGRTEVITKATSKMDLKMDMEYGNFLQAIVTNTRDNMFKVKSKDMVYLRGILEISIKETTLKMKEKAMDKCIGLMEVIIKVIGIKELKTEKVDML